MNIGLHKAIFKSVDTFSEYKRSKKGQTTYMSSKYHVGCGIAGIYAGTLRKDQESWEDKSEVTDEALEAVRDYFVLDMKTSGKKSSGCEWKLKNGGTVELRVSITEG